MNSTSNISVPELAITAIPSPYNSCDAYIEDVRTDMLEFHNIPRTVHYYMYFTLDFVVLPIICSFGIVGNILNLFILSRKQINTSMDRMERSVYLGLIALAVSDLMQCILFLTFLYRMPEYIRPLTILQEIHLFFYMYREALCNVFLFSSTWLTVLMAFGRYIAICHPINARSFVKLRVTCILIFLISVTSVLVSLPYIWKYETLDYSCTDWVPQLVPPEGCLCQIPARSPLYAEFHKNYHIFWVLIEFIEPLIILVFCNICLVHSLKKSYAMQREYRATRVHNPSLRITPTLVAIIFFFIIFISPSEMVKFLGPDSFKVLHNQRLIMTVTTILQSVNAAANFILYCIINVHFRKTIKRMFCCQENKRRMVGSIRSSQLRTNHTSVTYNMSEAETEI